MILILGGTAEARRLAQRLDEARVPTVLSLAGRTTAPLTVGEVRSGGFGGVDGLTAYLAEHGVGVVIDATHPFAAGISANAAAACAASGVRLVRLERPGWSGHELAGGWDWVDDHAAAAGAALEAGARRILLTVGRQHTLDYSPALDGRFVLARVAEGTGLELPAAWELLVSRGPFDLDAELALLRTRRIDSLITKDSGGRATASKLVAAHEVGARVVMIRRPPTQAGAEVVETVEEALALLDGA